MGILQKSLLLGHSWNEIIIITLLKRHFYLNILRGLHLNPPFLLLFRILGMHFKNSFPPKLNVILLGGAEAPPAPLVETPMSPAQAW